LIQMEQPIKKTRISEIDIFRGICLIGVLFAHLWFDLTLFYTVPELPVWITMVFLYGGKLFVILSGMCTIFSRSSFRRGCIVFACGMLITGVTFLLSKLMQDESTLILFGILHLIGICMMLTPLLRRLPRAVLLTAAVCCLIAGAISDSMFVSSGLLFPFGFIQSGFYSADYWPIFPNLGWYILGIVLGEVLYGEKKPLIPALQGKLPVLAWIGRNSLPIYLLQQPVCFGLILLFDLIFFHKIHVF